jgi:hypothetical protein
MPKTLHENVDPATRNRYVIRYITEQPSGAAHTCDSSAYRDDWGSAVEHAEHLQRFRHVEAVLGIEDTETGETHRPEEWADE